MGFAFAMSLVSILYALLLARFVVSQEPGEERMLFVHRAIRRGAKAYLLQQYKVVAIVFIILFAVLVSLSIAKLLNPFAPFAFLLGGFFSALAGYFGMNIATLGNVRTANAARESLNRALRVAFSSGAVMGMTVVGLALLHVSIWYYISSRIFGGDPHKIAEVLVTSGMGASFYALFARVGGGIYTKAADVGADLVGKVEAGIPEDDPRNPAVIADNVGDNVGDVAGMGADLFESYVGSLVAAMALGASAFAAEGDLAFRALVLPAVIAGLGALSAIIGTFLVRTGEEVSQAALLWALRRGIYFAAVLEAILSAFAVRYMLGAGHMGIYVATLIGLVAGLIISYISEYYTSDNYRPVKYLASQAQYGPAIVILTGISLAKLSTFFPVLVIALATICSYYVAGGGLFGLYGIALAGVGMLSTLGITLATDAYGPVADNAGGIAEMSGLPKEVRERTDALDALGNTTAATGKGFAIGSAALTALGLIAAFSDQLNKIAQQKGITLSMQAVLTNPHVIAGIFIGAALPFFFSALTIQAVSRTAGQIVAEVRRQFKEFGILEGKGEPDYERAVKLCTAAAQREMMLPSLLAVFAPILVGVFLGPVALLAMLAGALASGFLLAIYMANAGGAWDNAKKYIEKGNYGGKGSDPHKAAVIGDTVGDPFKDTAGPSLNILIKLMSMVSIVFAGLILTISLFK